MKQNILILSAALLLGATSCNSFLEEDPRSQVTSASYITTEAQAISNTNYLYRTGAPSLYASTGIYAGSKSMLGGYVSGYFDNEYAGQEIVVSHSKALTRNAVNIANDMDGIWDACYRSINVANKGIAEIAGVEGIDTNTATELIAASKFFRAYNYFVLVKTFGNVPMPTEPTTSPEGLEIPQTPAADVYALIISDLKDAVAGLPSGAFYNNSGEVTSNVANALLASVYMQVSGYPVQSNNYAGALTAAEAIITSGYHSLTANDDLGQNSAYNKLRKTDGLPEVIYGYEYNDAVSTSGWWPASSLPASAAGWNVFQYVITNNTYGLSNGIFNMYNPQTDLRMQEKQFFINEFEGVDKNGNAVKHTISPASNYYFYDEQAMLETGRGTKDVNIYRYAEILLIAAEAAAQTGDLSKAANYLSQVQARATLTGATAAEIASSLMSLSKDALIEEIWSERLRELPLEFRIWDDICRTRKYPTFSEANKGKVTFIDVVGATSPWGPTFTEKDLLWPISTNEMQRNPQLVQNPGYN